MMNDQEPITGPQAAYLARLIARVGKRRYVEIKNRLGLDGITIMQLSIWQAAKLIDALKFRREGDL